jgi:hypothetical protein
MKSIGSKIAIAFLALGMVAGASAQSAGQDMKAAGKDTKEAAKDTGRGIEKGASKAGHWVGHNTKRAVHKGAGETAKGAKHVEHKTAPNNNATGNNGSSR